MTETIGQRLKKARENRHLTLEKVAEVTYIRLAYLQAIEADDFSAMPSPIQARGFLRNYAQYLGLDLDEIIAELRSAEIKPVFENEVVFEGDASQPLPDLEPEISAPGESTEPGPPDDDKLPFWQSWLQWAKVKLGEWTSTSEDSEPAESVEDTSESSSQIESIPEEVQSEEPSSADKPGTPDEGGRSSLREYWQLLSGWFRIRLSRPTSEVETVQASQKLSEPALPLEPSRSSQAIFKEIGQQLRQRRELLGLTVEEIERHTRLRAQFLLAMETSEIDELPSPVQTRGMLSNYASFLDLDVDALLLQFADALQASHRERFPEKPAGRRRQPLIPESVPTLRSFIAGDLVFGLGVVVLLVLFLVWGIAQVISLQSQQTDVPAEATAPSISEALIGTPEETVAAEITLIPVEDTPLPAEPEETLEIQTSLTNPNVQINIVAVERTYLRVTVDGEIAFDGRTTPGNDYPFEAEESIEILAGNSSALRLAYNQRDLGLLGGFGQVANFIYTADEILTPTPAEPPTATNTPFVTPTPSVTPSPTLTLSPGDDLLR